MFSQAPRPTGNRRSPGTRQGRWTSVPVAEHREPCEARVSRPVVCPVKAGMFSRSQSCRGKSQKPRSLDSRVAGNQDSEAYRQDLPWGDHEPPGRNDSERKCGLESEEIRRPNPQPKGEGSMTSRNLTDAAFVTSPGWKRQHGVKDMPSNWRSPPRPGEKSPEQGRSYNRPNREVGRRREGGGWARTSNEAE